MTGVYPVLLISLAACAYAGCPTGTVYNEDSKMCYQYSSTAMSFIGAESMCKEISGHLASIQNGFINMEVQTQANTFFSCSGHSDYWLGGNTVQSPAWSWIDESPWSYTNWAPGQGGSSSSPQCLSATVSDGRWFSSSCDPMKAFVCAIPETTPSCPIIPTQCPVVQPTFTPPTSNPKPLVVVPTGYGFTWIGLNLQAGQWKWTDGTPFDYQIWEVGQPQNAYTCTKLVSDPYSEDTSVVGKWRANMPCDTTVMRAFVCKKKTTY